MRPLRPAAEAARPETLGGDLIGPAHAARHLLAPSQFVDAGMIDDKAFAQTKARALHRRGTSTRLTRQRLKMAGVDGDTLDRAMVGLDQELDTNPQQREWRAAAALARRRRLGPYRPANDRKDNRTRDLAAMARAGFAYDVAKKVIDATSPDALDEDR